MTYAEYIEQVKKILTERGTHPQVVDSITVDESAFFEDEFGDGFTPEEAVDNFEESLQ